MERCLIITWYKTVSTIGTRSVCKWRVQPCDRDLKERFLSFVCLFVYLFFLPSAFLVCFSSHFFCYPHFFPSAFFHPHPPSAGIRSAFYRHPSYASLNFHGWLHFWKHLRQFCWRKFMKVKLKAKWREKSLTRFNIHLVKGLIVAQISFVQVLLFWEGMFNWLFICSYWPQLSL